MMRGHDAFEALAGAVMLGEATPAERVAFDDHARTCASCRADADAGARAIASIARARAEETWRPSVTGFVLERIARTRMRGTRRTIGAFGWAIALSLAFNVAFASGATNWLAPNFHAGDEGAATQATTTITFDRAAARAAAAPNSAVQTPISTLAAHASHVHRALHRSGDQIARIVPRRPGVDRPTAAGAATVAARAVGSARAARSVDVPVPDILAGLDIEGSSGESDRRVGRRVAVEPRPCAGGREGPRAGERDFERERDDGCVAAAISPPPAPPAP